MYQRCLFRESAEIIKIKNKLLAYINALGHTLKSVIPISDSDYQALYNAIIAQDKRLYLHEIPFHGVVLTRARDYVPQGTLGDESEVDKAA